MTLRLVHRRWAPWLLMAAASCSRSSPEADTARTPDVRASVATVQADVFTQSITAAGTVLPAPGSAAALSAPASARVARVFVAEGDRVKVGDTLIAFDPTIFNAAVSRATGAVTAARHARDRADRLTQAGVAPRKELEQAQAAVADAEGALAAAEHAQSLTVLRSPITGVISRVTVVRDESVDPTRSVVEVVDPRSVEVVFGIPPRTAALIMPGSLVQLSSGVSVDNRPVGSARVVAIGSTVDATSRNVTVRARLLDASANLRVGESVIGRIAGASSAGVIVIPIEALIPDGETFHVFVVDAKGIAHTRPVKVLAQTDNRAHIAAGLAPGERVVTRGAFGVDEGVRIITTAP